MSYSKRLAALGAALWLIAAAGTAGPGEQTRVAALLRKTVVDPVVFRLETEDYLESHVAAMPVVKSAAEWEAIAARLRRELLEKVVFRGEAARWRDARTRVERLDIIAGGPGYHIQKLRIEILPGFWIPALLYLPDKLAGKVPVVLNVNGHTSLDVAYVPKQIRCINLAKRGIIALNLGWIGMGQLGGIGYDHYRLNQIDLCGTSGLAPFYLSLTRAIDFLLSLPNTDPARAAMAGLSGGGWQTIFCSALDPRVVLADPVAGFSSFKTRARYPEDLGDSEQAPVDMAAIADYTHLVGMRAPRPTLLTFNSKDDCCFVAGYALPRLLAAAEPVFRLYGHPERLQSHVNDDPGTHNFLKDNRQAFYKMIGDFFYPGDKGFSAVEIPSDGEVKSPEDLFVPLPQPNLDLHTLAVDLAAGLPRDPGIPGGGLALASWQKERRSLLRGLLRLKDYTLTAEAVPADKGVMDSLPPSTSSYTAAYWKLHLENGPSERWTIPAVEIVEGRPASAVILIADCGHAAAAPVADVLASNARLVVIDPYNIGEGRVHTRFSIHIASSGGRPLGIQVAQVAAVARWLAVERGAGPVRLAGVGPRACVMALCAAALEETAIASVELRQGMKSLKEALERNLTIEDAPELLTFGLLERFDIPQLAALAAPRPVIVK